MTPDPDFAGVQDARDRLHDVGYLTDDRLATTAYLQSALGKPLLLEGPAGVGKTQLAQSVAAATGRRLLRLQCYEGQDETKALYEWDYGKQLLYTQILREKIGQVIADAPDLPAAVERIAAQDSVFFSERFLAPGRCSRRCSPATRSCCSSTRSTGPTRRWRRCCWSCSRSIRCRCPRSARSSRRPPRWCC
ncbi:AAA family ATPase [Barrientosiimonas endolithica]|uniref:ATPase dynein-related AAA domain-containing protein n=1 Tax=Barrientosiimonas endolithica TaxID=1535208 RepID=A0ABM8H6P7_9MICO|nr:hypothetical protein GCM10025872_01220 [Barrientosiimonas endolithica]